MKKIRKPPNAIKRRRRSKLSLEDCIGVFERFSKVILRHAETSDHGPFGVLNVQRTGFELPRGTINVVFQVKGGFGVADELFEALKVLNSHKLPRSPPRKAASHK